VPEGDTIHRAAATLDRVLAGKPLVRFDAPTIAFRPFPVATVVEGAEAHGKHCLIHFDDGRTLRTHMRMNGSWHVYRSGERWRKPRAALRALVAVPGWDAVCFSAPLVELTPARAASLAVAHLGPDLVEPDADLDEAEARLVARGGTIGDALLDQRVASGVGNIWRNEACFACGVHADTAVDDIAPATRRRLLEVAARQLRASTAGSRPAPMVYGRAGEACRRCGVAIAWRRSGEHHRGIYWCPACQPEPGGTAPR
jgi:endonuclease-8